MGCSFSKRKTETSQLNNNPPPQYNAPQIHSNVTHPRETIRQREVNPTPAHQQFNNNASHVTKPQNSTNVERKTENVNRTDSSSRVKLNYSVYYY
jgi:hypothetical protein